MSDEPEFVFAPVHATMVTQEGEDLYEESLTPACDFCLDTRVRWEYPCEKFFIDELRFGSDGEWLACERCAKLIEGKLFANLAARSLLSHVRRQGACDQELIDSFGVIQHGFFDHRSGPRVPYVKEFK